MDFDNIDQQYPDDQVDLNDNGAADNNVNDLPNQNLDDILMKKDEPKKKANLRNYKADRFLEDPSGVK